MHYGFLLSRPPFNDRTLPRDRLVFRLEPVRYDDCSEEFLNCYSSGSGFFAKKSVGLFAEGHHDLIRRVFSRSQFSNIQTDPSNTYTVCMSGARHIRVTEKPAEKFSSKFGKETLDRQLHLFRSKGCIVSCRGLSRAARVMENSR